MKPVNAVSTDRGKSLFLTDDPQYLMDIPELDGGPAWLEVEYRFDILSEQEEKLLLRKDKRFGGAADKSPASVVGRTAQGHFIRNEENEKVRFSWI